MRSSKEKIDIDFAAAIHHASFAVVITASRDCDQRIVFVNPAFTVLTGYESDEVVGLNCRFLQGPDSDRSTVAEVCEAINAGEPLCREVLNYRKDKSPFWNSLTLSPRHDKFGELVGYLGFLSDVSGTREANEARCRAEIQLADIADNVPGYLFQRVLKPDGTLELPYLSQGLASLLGVPAGRGKSPAELQRLIHPADIADFDAEVRRSAANMTRLTSEFRVITGGAEERWIRTASTPRRVGADVVWDGIGLDITEEKNAQERLSFLAYNDPLTGLPNRALLESSLHNDVSGLGSQNSIGLFHVDIAGLQEVNDVAGRRAGDAVLRNTAQRLASSFGQTGTIVARTGGDEFAVTITGVDTAAQAEALAVEMVDCVSQPVAYDDEEIDVRICVGFTTGSGRSQVENVLGDKLSLELMRQADIALVAAKGKGPGCVSAYEIGADDRIRHRLLLKQSLHRALTQQQFELHYHPLVELSSGRIVGAEALIRWRHPDLGMQRPDVFIPIAEESGLIVPIGEWVVREAMRQAAEWKREGLQTPRIAINVSSKQIQSSDFPLTLERALADFGREASEFELELTEGVLIGRSSEIMATLHRMKALGFDLALDDFGTGYSSLQYIHSFPVNKIKIDQSFIRRMVVDSSDASIIRAIIAMARSLQLDVVAEGIETTMQRDFLRDEGCRIGQGYLFSLPLVAEDFAWLLRQGAPLPFTGEPGKKAHKRKVLSGQRS